MPNTTLTHRQRLEACLADGPLDRPPVALWRHFPVDDQTPEGLAKAALAFQRTFDFDLVKLTPASSFCLKDWGVDDEWRGATEGTRDYTRRVIFHPEDWEKLPMLDPHQGHLGAQLRSLEMLVKELGPETPVLQTIFSPMAQAKNLVGGALLLAHLRKYPQAVHAGLKIIAEGTRRFIEACLPLGLAGVFYAVQHAQYGLLTEAEFRDFVAVYDLLALEPAAGLWLNMLHLHGEQVMFDAVQRYPLQIINWHDRDTFPSLKEARGRTKMALCGGLQRERTMVLGTPEMVISEGRQAIEAVDGRRFILGTGCVTPTHAPYGNLLAARQCVE
jgi:uroporphyrinogen decarboxylase